MPVAQEALEDSWLVEPADANVESVTVPVEVLRQGGLELIGVGSWSSSSLYRI